VVQSGAVCCSIVVHCGAVWCNVVQCGAVCCSSVLQCGAVLCSVVQCGAVWCSVVQCCAVWCIVVQCGAVQVAQSRKHTYGVTTISRFFKIIGFVCRIPSLL